MTTTSTDATTPDDGPAAAPTDIDQGLAGWTHAWASTANETYKVIAGFDTSDLTAISRRDVMTLLLVDAARNVERGAVQLGGPNSKAVRRFAQEHPTLKTLRDRIEHFDEYVRGEGNAQRVGGNKSGAPLDLNSAGLKVQTSYGGGREGHVIEIKTIELEAGKRVEKRYAVPTREVIVAVRTLARDTLHEADLLDQQHLARCEMCQDPEGI